MRESCGDGVTVAQPLFQVEGQGSIPMSPLHLDIQEITVEEAVFLNNKWHSRLPKITNPYSKNTICFGAVYKNCFFASAIWSDPIARYYNNTGRLELRRFAISDKAPKQTGTRMISIMTKLIKKKYSNIWLLISYQDTDVHKGIIYKASGWEKGGVNKNIVKGWNTRKRNIMQSDADKIRWEKKIREKNEIQINKKMIKEYEQFEFLI